MSTFNIYSTEHVYLGSVRAKSWAEAELQASERWPGKAINIRMCG